MEGSKEAELPSQLTQLENALDELHRTIANCGGNISTILENCLEMGQDIAKEEGPVGVKQENPPTRLEQAKFRIFTAQSILTGQNSLLRQIIQELENDNKKK